VRLTPPDAEALRTIVLGPFERYPDAFERAILPSLADRLVEAILARGDAGGSGRLSELQLVCRRLWHSDDPEGLFAEVGLQALLEDELSASIDRLDLDVRDTAIALLGQLVTQSGSRNVVSEEDLVERVERETGTTGAKLRVVLSSLERESRLVRREVRHDVAFYEIVSEFLVPWIARRRSRVEISRVLDAKAPDRTTFALGRLGDVATSVSELPFWREQVLIRIAELRLLASSFADETVDGGSTDTLDDAFTQHLRAARASVDGYSNSGPLRRCVAWFRGSAVERAAASIDAAEAALLQLAPADYLRGQLPSLVAHVRKHLESDDPLRVRIEVVGQDVAAGSDTSDVLDRGRGTIAAAVSAASAAARRAVARARSFRNVVLTTAACLAIVAAGLALVGATNPDAVPLCFQGTGATTVVCPTNEAATAPAPALSDGTPSSKLSSDGVDSLIASTAGPWDVLVVELLGLLGGALAAGVAMRDILGKAPLYSLAVALALLKLPAGAITAVSGLLLLGAGFVPGFTALDRSTQILAYALVLGYAQQLFTRLVDERAHVLFDETDAVASPRPPPPDRGDPKQ
jgi:hypothetical protein